MAWLGRAQSQEKYLVSHRREVGSKPLNTDSFGAVDRIWTVYASWQLFFSLMLICTAEALGFIPSEEDSVNWYQVSYGGLEVVVGFQFEEASQSGGLVIGCDGDHFVCV